MSFFDKIEDVTIVDMFTIYCHFCYCCALYVFLLTYFKRLRYW